MTSDLELSDTDSVKTLPEDRPKQCQNICCAYNDGGNVRTTLFYHCTKCDARSKCLACEA